jgi:isoquinoline 1-oxidoreductase beta subunit
MTTFTINGKPTTVDLPSDTPLLWVIREHLKLTGTKYGCGISQCGACTVLVNGSAIRSCVRPLSSVEGAEIITIEGLHPEGQHPLQKSWVTHQVPQCGYCQSGAILQAADLLNNKPNPSDGDIVKAMNANLCRCMTYSRMKDAIKAAAKDMPRLKGEASKSGGEAKDTEETGIFAARSSGAGGRVRFAYETVGKDIPEGNFARNLWFEMDANGIATINIAKAEMGQHVGTALAQTLAEGLEVRWEDVYIRHVDTDPKWGLMITGGSWSVNWTFDTLSRAGAAGRMALIDAGAKILNVDSSQCQAENSSVVDPPSGQSITYAEIIQKTAVSAEMDEEALQKLTLKDPKDYKIVKQSLDALDIPAKTDGTAKYSIDEHRPGMVYGHLVTPPVRYGAQVISVDESEARKVSGYLQAVTLDDPTGYTNGFVVAVADAHHAAVKAAGALKVDWDKGANKNVDSAALAKAAEALAENPKTYGNWVLEGDAGKVISESQKTHTASYTTELNIHAPLEPVNAIVELKDGLWHAWAGNQNQSTAVPLMAQALGVELSEVVIHQYYLGGGFGKRLECDYIVVAALTAKAVGKPVKIIYTREQDTRFDICRSPSHQVMRGALDKDGRLTAVTHDVVAGWPTARIMPDFLAETADKKSRVDSFAVSGADFWYSVPNHQVRAIQHDLAQQVVPPGYLRTVGPGFTTFAAESFIDEMADLAGVDPVKFRLGMLDGADKQAGHAPNAVGGASRLKKVLETAVNRSSYGQKSLSKHTAMGVACGFGQERDMPTWTTCVAEVSVNPEEGKFKVKKLTLVADVGISVNPRNTQAQMQGALLWGLSVATKERGSVSNGAIEQKNFHQYTPLRMADIPEIDIHLIENDYYPVGAGEPALSVVAPAIANAIAEAVGARVRDLPITPGRVKDTLK